MESIMLGKGKDQENLNEFSGQYLQPYILSYLYVHVFKVQRYLKAKGQRNKSSGGNTHLMKVNNGYHQEWGSKRSQVDRTNQK